MIAIQNQNATATFDLRVNDKSYTVSVDPGTPLLWVLRDTLGLTGTKFGCGIARCGACTVHVDGKAVKSCSTAVSKVAGKTIITIEGISASGLHPLQQAWIDEDVPQCGYCHSGQIMAAAALLTTHPVPTDAEIDAAMSGNICRCGTYQRIRRAIHRAAEMMEQKKAVPSSGFYAAAGSEPVQAVKDFMLNPFIHIGTDDSVTILVNKSEMGQGVYTSMPMLVVEELQCDWNKVRVEAAPVDVAYNHTEFGIQMTGGSTSVWSEWERLGKAGADARERLIAAAAGIWGVNPKDCRAENGRVIHSSGKALAYGKLAERAADIPPQTTISLKNSLEFNIIGKSSKRLDAPEKVNGQGIFGFDVLVPGMLTALIARPPVFGGKVLNFDAQKAKSISGVVDVVAVPAGVAVVATGFWPAKLGRDALNIAWDEGINAGISTSGMRMQYTELARSPGTIARKEGQPETLRNAAKQISAEYEVPYLAHAPMEPLNCLVDLRDKNCEIWTGTQFQTVDRDAAARVAGLEPGQVKIHTTLLGGGFGRRANPKSDFVTEAVHVAKVVKNPVKVVWSREDDIKGGYYRPMWYDRLSAGLDSHGNPVCWQHTIVGQSILTGTPFEEAMVGDGIDATSVEGAREIPYNVPNVLVDLHSPIIGVPVQWWRSVGHSHTAFVVESFIDELAHAAGQDPYEFRNKLLDKQPRHKGVLELAARKADWGMPLPAGRSRGIAVHASFGSFVSQVAEVSVDQKGQLTVHRVVCAVDCGRVVNPDIIAAQMEGGIVYGLTAALKGAITLDKGRVQQSNFHDYRMLAIKEMPAVEVHIVPSQEAPGGVGEIAVPPIAPAVTNAIFAATGKRIRQLPVSLLNRL